MLNGQDVLLLTTMKNEGPYILEWIAHHLAVGIDRFMVFTNDCDEGTDLILDRLSDLIPLLHVPNPKLLFRELGNWQVMAQRYATLFGYYRRADWIYIADCDEFLQISVGRGTLEDFRRQVGDFDAVSFTSMPFGTSGIVDLVDKPVMEQFTVSSKPYAHARAEGTVITNAVKTLYRNIPEFSMRRNHRPHSPKFSQTGLRWINGSGEEFPPAFTEGRGKGVEALNSTRYAWFNHYALRSVEGYLIKLARGDVVGADRLKKSRRYFGSYNVAGDVDTRAARLRPDTRKWLDRFLKDPELARLHRFAFENHKAKAEKLRETPEAQYFLSPAGPAPLATAGE